jgi:GT2 family glycosyltransferase
MNITLVLAVYNNIHLTKEFYKRLRIIYPHAPLVISNGGSTDDTNDWLLSLNDSNLKYYSTSERISFSDTYNMGLSLVETDKFVLVHNDMVIGNYFLENLEKLISEDTLLSYTTIEPPIFAGHRRPGKVIMDLGSSFDDFNQEKFDEYVLSNKDNCILYDGAVFFMSGYKKMFDDIGGFDGKTFFPCFCEDDDFLLRARLKNYKLKTTECVITYHFVSQTSRFSDEMKNKRIGYERYSIRNFIRKWGVPIGTFNQMEYWKIDDFNFKKTKLSLSTNVRYYIEEFEPFFDKIICDDSIEDYIKTEQKHTNFDLLSKFINDELMTNIKFKDNLTSKDFEIICQLQLIIPHYGSGIYEVGNLIIEIP